MDPAKLSAVGHAGHRFQSPVSPETLDRVLAFARLATGARVFDLGCGHAGMAMHIAERYGAQVEAVERSPLMIRAARARLRALSAPGAVRLHNTTSTEFLKDAEPCDLLVGIGAINLAGPVEPTQMLRALAEHVRPGGAILWGESIWEQESSDFLKATLGAQTNVYKTHAASAEAGLGAGLQPVYATTASDQEWDEYAWRYITSVEDWCAANPDDADAPTMRARIQAWRALYLHQTRGVMGFGLYLFRKPM